MKLSGIAGLIGDGDAEVATDDLPAKKARAWKKTEMRMNAVVRT